MHYRGTSNVRDASVCWKQIHLKKTFTAVSANDWAT